MKAPIQILGLCLLLALMGCQEDEQKLNQTEVEKYIARLQSGDYDEMALPPFTHEAIPALLSYRNSTELITSFPRNPISSAYSPDCTLGMYTLWTIESIRLSHLAADTLMPGRFPSLNPILARRNAAELQWIEREEAQSAASAAYYAWWLHAQHMNLDIHMQTDPLADTDYRWH